MWNCRLLQIIGGALWVFFFFFLELRQAIESQDLELLERAVDMVESRGYAHRLSAELKEAKDLIARLKRLQKLVHEVIIITNYHL